ncbi:MAG: ABC transporter ATP-binding protein [Polyangiaceae bacterium]|nr:ABC transporter ATP-binding protein [Polyangiaceae bacterium]
MSVIVAQGLTRTFGTGEAARRAVDDVSLSVAAGEVVLIFGPSGCGKSTLLALIGGLDRAFSGSLSLFGQDVATLSDAALSRLRGEKIGFVFQAFHLLAHLSVIENVMAPALFSPHDRHEGEVRARAGEVLARVGLADRALSGPAELSGGQRQRVAIARALLHQPSLLLCDEPTGNLDRKTGEQIIELFAELHAELGTTIVIVTHEERLSRLADRTLDMVDGKLEAGSAP